MMKLIFLLTIGLLCHADQTDTEAFENIFQTIKDQENPENPIRDHESPVRDLEKPMKDHDKLLTEEDVTVKVEENAFDD
eukprot:01587.XXX_6152_5010_1 [CDS] Oithona nana genome sequencing.